MRTRERQLRTFSSKHPGAFLCLIWVVWVVFETESLAWVRLAFWSSCPRLLIGRLWPWTNVYSCKSCFCVMRTVSLTPRAPPIICIFMCKYRKNSGIVFFHSVKNDTSSERKATEQTWRSYPPVAFRKHSYPNFPASGDQKTISELEGVHETIFILSIYRKMGFTNV